MKTVAMKITTFFLSVALGCGMLCTAVSLEKRRMELSVFALESAEADYGDVGAVLAEVETEPAGAQVDWEIKWRDEGVSLPISKYYTVVPKSDGAKTAVIYCHLRTDYAATLTASLRGDSGVSAERTLRACFFGQDEEFNGFDPSDPAPYFSGEVGIAMSGFYGSTKALYPECETADRFWALTQDTVLTQNYDGTFSDGFMSLEGGYEPGERNSGGLNFTVTDPDARFSNGETITADDVVRTLRYIVSDSYGGPYGLLRYLIDPLGHSSTEDFIEGGGDQMTIYGNFSAEQTDALFNLLARIPVLHEYMIESYSFSEGMGIYSGSYAWSEGELEYGLGTMTLTANTASRTGKEVTNESVNIVFTDDLYGIYNEGSLALGMFSFPLHAEGDNIFSEKVQHRKCADGSLYRLVFNRAYRTEEPLRYNVDNVSEFLYALKCVVSETARRYASEKGLTEQTRHSYGSDVSFSYGWSEWGCSDSVQVGIGVPAYLSEENAFLDEFINMANRVADEFAGGQAPISFGSVPIDLEDRSFLNDPERLKLPEMPVDLYLDIFSPKCGENYSYAERAVRACSDMDGYVDYETANGFYARNVGDKERMENDLDNEFIDIPLFYGETEYLVDTEQAAAPLPAIAEYGYKLFSRNWNLIDCLIYNWQSHVEAYNYWEAWA